MAYRKRKQTKRSRHLRKQTRNRKQKTRRVRRMRGGALQIDSISKEHEADTIVTVRPDSREVDSIPMTGRLTVMRELLEE